MLRRWTFALIAGLAMFAWSQAHAAVTYSSLSSWEAAAGSFVETPTFAGIADGTTVTSLTLNGGTVLSAFSPSLVKATIGDGWATWSGGFTGSVFHFPNYTGTSFSASISPVNAFGFFAEPDPFDIINITLTLAGGGTLTQAVQGDSGADFFGWVGGGITSFTVTSTTDFAIGDFFATAATAAVPEPGSLVVFGTMLIGFAGFLYWRRKAQ